MFSLINIKNREWYSWHFPELAALVSEPHLFVNVANAIRSRADQASEKEKTKALTKTFGGDKKKAKTVLKAAAESIGFDISAVDMAHFGLLAGRFLSLHSYRNVLAKFWCFSVKLMRFG